MMEYIEFKWCNIIKNVLRYGENIISCLLSEKGKDFEELMR